MNTSVSEPFLAGIIPGLMIGIFQMILVYFFARTRNYPRTARFSMKELFKALRESTV